MRGPRAGARSRFAGLRASSSGVNGFGPGCRTSQLSLGEECGQAEGAAAAR